MISNLNLGNSVSEAELKNSVTVSSVKETEIIKITVTTKIPVNSSKIANEIAKVFAEKVKEIYSIENVQVVDEAETPTTPSNINHRKDIIVFAFIGVVVAAMYVLIANMLDTTVKTAEDVEKQFKVTSILLSIPMYNFRYAKKEVRKDNENKKRINSRKNPKSPISEVFRTLRTNIQFMDTSKKMKTLLLTSTLPGEGKSWVSSNLAVTFAQAGKKVILIDADMRKGRQYTIFGVSPRPGLSNYLSEIDIERPEINEDLSNVLTKNRNREFIC